MYTQVLKFADLVLGVGVLFCLAIWAGRVAAWVRMQQHAERRQRVLGMLLGHGGDSGSQLGRALGMGILAGVSLKLAVHAVSVGWPLALGAVGVGFIAYWRCVTSAVRARRQLCEASLERYIRSSLTDEALNWAVSTWSKRYRR